MHSDKAWKVKGDHHPLHTYAGHSLHLSSTSRHLRQRQSLVLKCHVESMSFIQSCQSNHCKACRHLAHAVKSKTCSCAFGCVLLVVLLQVVVLLAQWQSQDACLSSIACLSSNIPPVSSTVCSVIPLKAAVTPVSHLSMAGKSSLLMSILAESCLAPKAWSRL